MIRVVSLLFLVFFLMPRLVKSQDIIEGATNTWFLANTRVQITPKWSANNELHYRLGQFLSDPGQVLIRPSLEYRLNFPVEFSAGYTFIHAQPYKAYESPMDRNENNIWEQVLLRQTVGKVNFQHRFRQEHRWIDKIVDDGDEPYIDGKDFRNRFRYRITLSVDLLQLGDEENSIFAAIFDEIWVNQTEKLIFSDFARNWWYIGLGYNFDSDTNLQFGFIHQSDKAGPNTFIQSPILQLSFFKTFDLSKKSITES